MARRAASPSAGGHAPQEREGQAVAGEGVGDPGLGQDVAVQRAEHAAEDSTEIKAAPGGPEPIGHDPLGHSARRRRHGVHGHRVEVPDVGPDVEEHDGQHARDDDVPHPPLRARAPRPRSCSPRSIRRRPRSRRRRPAQVRAGPPRTAAGARSCRRRREDGDHEHEQGRDLEDGEERLDGGSRARAEQVDRRRGSGWWRRPRRARPTRRRARPGRTRSRSSSREERGEGADRGRSRDQQVEPAEDEGRGVSVGGAQEDVRRRPSAAACELSSARASAPHRLTSPKPTHRARIATGSPTTRASV